jgi:hypothetical protein
MVDLPLNGRIRAAQRLDLFTQKRDFLLDDLFRSHVFDTTVLLSSLSREDVSSSMTIR